MSAALFLDRDGVINFDYGYVCSPSRIKFTEGIFELCRHANNVGYSVFVITNQAGIGRGYYTYDAFFALMQWMENVFRSQGCPIQETYFCPHHPTAGVGVHRRDCNWRKPKPGMLLAAEQDYCLDLHNSILVGDRITDIAAGQAAGVGSNLLYTPNSGEQQSKYTDIIPTDVVQHLHEVKSYLTKSV